MFKNYFKIALRNIIRNKLYAFVNTIGLSIGLASFIFIGLYVYNELGYDIFWEKADCIYRVDAAWTSNEGESRYATAPPPLASVMMDEIPQVEIATRILKRGDFTLRPETDHEKIFRETNVYIADNNYFKVFSKRLISGNPETALVNPVSIVISESAAIRYFGQEYYANNNLIGKHILGGKDAGTLWKITGIMKDIPVNSHQDFNMIVSMSTLGSEFTDNSNWSWNIMHTYVRMNSILKSIELQNATDGLDNIIQNHALPYMGQPENEGNGVKYYFLPIKDIHLYSSYLREMTPNGDITYIYIFGVIALLILLIACVNFTNLATALSIKRSKEVGVRKVMGSGSSSLVYQFLLESLLFSVIATIIALGLVELCLILFRESFDLNFVIGLFDKSSLMLAVAGITILTGVIAGIYPALLLTHFKPADVLKGKSVPIVGGMKLRNALMVFQFTASTGLIIATGIISDQLEFISNRHLGFDKENVLIIQNDREIEEDRTRFKEALNSHPQILNVSFSTGIPALNQFMVRDYAVEGRTGSRGLRWFEVDDSFAETLDLKIVEGRNFQFASPSDSLGLLLNQKAVKELRLIDPVGKHIIINKGDNDERTVRITGIVKDFHFESLHKEVKPLGMEFLRGYVFKDFICIRIVPGNVSETVEIIKDAWSEFEPQVPITYSFLDQDFDTMYKSEERLGKMFNNFSMLAMIIAGLGLFGLAAAMVQQRNKEIGIRKVLGASVIQIVLMLLHNYTLMALLGLLIASGIMVFAMEEWLSLFAFRTDIRPEQFLTAILITCGIMLLSVSYQTVKAALENPANSLKEE